MSEAIVPIIVALISGLSVAIPTIITTVMSNKAHDLVIDEKMKNMEGSIESINTKIDKYASNVDALKERIVVCEQSSKSAHHRIDDIVRQLKITERRG